MNILFIGCVESSYLLLSELLAKGKNVVGVVTKKQSSFNADYCDIAPLASEKGIPICYVQNVNDSECIDFVQKVNADICFCFGWSQLLKEKLIGLFPKGVVGFHPAALPCNRGRHPLIWALALGLDKTASSFFLINTGADEGDIVSQETVEISYEDDARSLYDKVMSVAVKQEIELVDAFECGKVNIIKQNPCEGNSWRKRGRKDGQIDWRMSSRAIYNLVRSLAKPYVGAHFEVDGNEFKVWKVEEMNIVGLDNIEPGKVLKIHEDGTMIVKTYDGAIKLIDYDKTNLCEGDYLL